MKVPAIGFGVYAIPRQDTARCVQEALEVGYRLIDTAQLYHNEKESAEGIRLFLKKHPEVPRSDIIYVSKIWDTDFGYDAAKAQIEQSYQNAGEAIDVYLMHSSGHGKKERLETWKALQEAVDQKKIRHLGVSNWGIHHLKELLEWKDLRYRPVINEIEVNPWKQMRELVAYCKQESIDVLGYSPLILGSEMHRSDLQSLVKKYHRTPAQILFRWLIQNNVIPIPKTTHKERMIDNLGSLSFEMSESDCKSLGDVNSYVMALPGWDPTKWD